MRAPPPLNNLVRSIVAIGYVRKDAISIVLRAFKWQEHAGKWIPPYNKHIMFDSAEALRVSGEVSFLCDTASGRFDGITDNGRKVYTGNENGSR